MVANALAPLIPGLHGFPPASYNPSMVAANFETESEILARVIAPQNPELSQEAAESLLKLRFAPGDTERMNELAEKARQGTLSPDEDRLLQGYLFVGSLVDLLHSKARRAHGRQRTCERRSRRIRGWI
jgi:hypothetical protein